MKNLFIGLFLSMTMIIYSCTKVEDQPVNKEKKEMLSFNSIEEMQQTVNKLILMNGLEKKKWYELNGNFISQDSLKWIASNEIDKAKSLNEIRSLKDKYSKYFIFNKNEKEQDNSPYIPSNNLDYSLVCNKEGKVIIAGKIMNYNTLKSFEETKYFKSRKSTMKGVIASKNKLYGDASRRKYWAEACVIIIDGKRIGGIDFTAQKRGLFGWNWYRTTYTIEYLYARGETPPGWANFHPEFRKLVIDGTNPATTQEFGAHTFLPIGEIQAGQTAYMDLRISSRGTGDEGKGILQIELQ